MVSRLEDYKWFSHGDYLVLRQGGEWLYKEIILNMLSQKTDPRQAYLKFVHGDDSDKITEIFNAKKWPVVLGSENFFSWVKEAFFAKKRHREIPDSAQLAPDRKNR